MKSMKFLSVVTVPLLGSGIAGAQSTTMVDLGNTVAGWMPVLLIVIVVALVVFILERNE